MTWSDTGLGVVATPAARHPGRLSRGERGMELMAGARGDEELRSALRTFDRRIDDALSGAVHRLVGWTAESPGFDDSLLLSPTAAAVRSP
ncbi:hypothetical protein [Streptomyces sp. NPDC058247]|uniref:hypothetical protein n=1 Tax=Streptomyces sp. NPDC058247 TaxID=3346401 RepID=UPI0036E9BD78